MALAAAGAVLAGSPAQAQFRVEVAGVGLTQVPFSVASFRGEAGAPQKIGAIVQADLERSGQFRSVAVNTKGDTLDESTRPDLSLWRQAASDALVTGSVTRQADGRYDVRFRLWDVVAGKDLGGQSYLIAAADLRLAAHRVADYVYEQLTGEKGVFSTRIAYITKNEQRYTLWVADADGEAAQPALSSPEPIISPSWSPDGKQLAYVSFEARRPVVYVHEVSSGRRRLVASFRGSNSAPAWSPDGKSLAVTLSRDGGSQLYTLDLDNLAAEPTRVTRSASIDTEPTYSADGRFIYFVSDRGGNPQIYRLPARGGSPERVTFTGAYNISPALSPDGRWLAYVSRNGDDFKLTVQELDGNGLAKGNATALTNTSADDSPSFAPNSRLIVYATKQNGREALMTTTLDGNIKARLSGQTGDIHEPDWGPFMGAVKK